MYTNKILPVVLYGRKTWSLTFRDERRLRMFENRVLGRIFGPKKDEVTVSGEDHLTRTVVIGTAHYILFGLSNQEE